MNRGLALMILISVMLFAASAWASDPPLRTDSPKVERPIPTRIELVDRQADLLELYRLEIDVDAVFGNWARIYVSAEESEKLASLGYALAELPDEGAIGLARMLEEGVAGGVAHTRSVPAQYHTYATLTDDLATVAAQHPAIARLSSIGTSVQGRELWVMKITDNPDVEEDEPEFVYISSMHGDEVTGKELCFNLINYLTDNYGTDPRITSLIDGAEIWILPSMNPDGTELGQRYNANGVDLNRDFPDYFVDPVNTSAGRARETGLAMAWASSLSVMLSGSMHGGALVVNYPLDGNPQGSSTFSPAPDPDHDAFVSISRTYADNNPPLSQSNSDPAWDDGITNGADWYLIRGGIQDWGYFWGGNMLLTLEVSSNKWPPASQLPTFWDDNLESMLAYFERGFEGVRGIVTDGETGLPIDAEIRLDANPHPVYTDRNVGDYHRMVLPGAYTMQVSAAGYDTRSIPIAVSAGTAAVYDVAMYPEPPDLQFQSVLIDDGPGGDGWLDAGESADLAATVLNLGRAASSISAQLEPTGWYADVWREGATFGDVAMNGTVESDAPHFGIDVSPSVPIGHRVGYALRWTSAEGSGTSEPVYLDVGQPDCAGNAATDLPQTVSPLVTATSQVPLNFGEIDEVRVTIDIQHPFIGELLVTLQAPSGTSVVLHAGSGGSSDDIVGTYGVDLVPAQSLSVLQGQSASGTWTLTVEDDAFINNGSLEAFSIEVCGRPGELETPRMRFRDLVREPGGEVRMDWWSYPGLTSYRVYRATDPTGAGNFVDVTGADILDTDTRFVDGTAAPIAYYLVTGVGPQGEGPLGHFGQ